MIDKAQTDKARIDTPPVAKPPGDTPPRDKAQASRDRIYQFFSSALHTLAQLLDDAGLRPNHVTWLGVSLNLVVALLITQGLLVAAGVIWLIAGILDLLDGLLARTKGLATPFGAFLDSTTDRISDGVVFAAMIYAFAQEGAGGLAALTALVLMGSFVISYTRARAEGLGVSCRSGWLTRFERVLLIGIGLCFGVLVPVIYLMAVLSAVTVVQRVLETRRALDARESQNKR